MKVFPIFGSGLSSNIYLISGERNILIDTGSGADAEEIVEKIDAYLGNGKLEAIILTHRHMDHIGGAERIAKHFKANVYAQREEAQAINSGDAESTCAYAFGMKPPEIHVRNVEELNFEEIEVIETPGHTSGSISIYFPGQKWLFSGDTVFLYGSTGRWDLPTGNLRQLKESIERLARLDVEGLFPGHEGYAETEGGEHIRAALEALNLEEDFT